MLKMVFVEDKGTVEDGTQRPKTAPVTQVGGGAKPQEERVIARAFSFLGLPCLVLPSPSSVQ